jgi:CheY-like chemotaxis protein
MTSTVNAKPIEILLVEDNPGDVDLTKAALRRCKMTINLTVARDGVQALAMLRREVEYAGLTQPHMILLDLNLPKKSGQEVLAEIKQDAQLRRIPVAVVTSSQAEEDVLRSYDLHANRFLTKRKKSSNLCLKKMGLDTSRNSGSTWSGCRVPQRRCPVRRCAPCGRLANRQKRTQRPEQAHGAAVPRCC